MTFLSRLGREWGGARSGNLKENQPGRLDRRRSPDWQPSRPFEMGSAVTDFGITSDGPRMFFLSGELDLGTLPLMERAIAPAVAKGGPITLDLSELMFIDSSGVGSIIRNVKDLPSGCIILHGVRGAVQRILELMGVKTQNLHVIPCSVPI